MDLFKKTSKVIAESGFIVHSEATSNADREICIEFVFLDSPQDGAARLSLIDRYDKVVWSESHQLNKVARLQLSPGNPELRRVIQAMGGGWMHYARTRFLVPDSARRKCSQVGLYVKPGRWAGQSDQQVLRPKRRMGLGRAVKARDYGFMLTSEQANQRVEKIAHEFHFRSQSEIDAVALSNLFISLYCGDDTPLLWQEGEGHHG